ncbi:MAG TPA: sortase [Anaerolineales bacterium]|nr:sortase [Anaerolineales bacterium]
MRSVSLILFLVLIGLVSWGSTNWFTAGNVSQTNVRAEEEISQSLSITSSLPEEPPPATAAQPGITIERVASSGIHLPGHRVSAPQQSPGGLQAEVNNVPSPQNVEADETINRLVIPSLRVDAKVVFVPFSDATWDLTSLEQDVAWLGKMPSQAVNKNFVLASHVTVGNAQNGPFRYLSRLAPGAKVIVYTEKQILTYLVRDLAIVNPGDVSITQETTRSQLTLLTCTTWDEKTKSYLRRQVVFAELVKVESNLDQEMD